MQNNTDQKRAPRYGARPHKFRNGWRISWTDIDRKRHFRTFKKCEVAAAELERFKGITRAMKDGVLARPAKPITFADFVEIYYKPNRTEQKRQKRDDVSIFKVHLSPTFGALPVAAITTARCEEFKGKLLKADLAPATVGNILALLSAVLHYAHELDMLPRLPKIRKPKVVVTQFAYLETENEIRAFLSSAREEGPLVLTCYATAIYTGMRAGELFGLEWSKVNFETRMITVVRSYNQATKTGKTRYVPVLDPLLPILREWRLQCPGELVFPTSVGTMHAPAARVQQEVFHAVLERAELPRIRFHDLRHTFASRWVAAGGDIFRLQKILGHSTQHMTQRYAHLAPDAFTQDYGIFGATAPTGEPAEVVVLEQTERGGHENSH
jgi:integrase